MLFLSIDRLRGIKILGKWQKVTVNMLMRRFGLTSKTLSFCLCHSKDIKFKEHQKGQGLVRGENEFVVITATVYISL